MKGKPARPPAFFVADDDAALRRLLGLILGKAFPGSSVTPFPRPDGLVDAACDLRPDVIFLDWVFRGGRTGASVCRELKTRTATRRIPVVLMTGLRADLRGRLGAVRSGAEVFLAKPFSSEEVVGYCRALLGRRSRRTMGPFRLGGLTLHPADRSVWWGKRKLPSLPGRPFALLSLLARHSPAPVPVEKIVRWIWCGCVRDKHVTLTVARLRRRLGPLRGLRIESVPPRGYRLLVS